MKLTQKDLKACYRDATEKPKPGLRTALSMLLVAAPMGLAACNPCPVDSSCSTNDYDITLKEGESKETMSNGQKVTIQVLSISVDSAMNGTVCETHGGGATIHLTVESETPFEQDIVITPSMCFSITNRCIGISDVSLGSDFAAPDGGLYDGTDAGVGTSTGACAVTNKSVSFMLTLGE